jgi:hypothetical protein
MALKELAHVVQLGQIDLGAGDPWQERCSMTRLLEKAIAEVSRLSEPEQDALAAWLFEELASERRWSKSFAESEDALARLADEALAEHRSSRTQPLDADRL